MKSNNASSNANTNTNATATTNSASDDENATSLLAPTELHLLTLNCWGLLHISTQRTPRLDEIGRQLARLVPAPHIVCLQECWVQEDYHAIRRHTRQVLPYGKFYHSGAFGGGLAILSRFPIEESTMFKYPLNGRPTAFWRGDWYVGKGVACAKIRFGPDRKDVVEVFNTHTHAPYGRQPDNTYQCHRTAQIWELSKLLRGAAERGHLVLALGDFNMVPVSLAHRILEAHSPVRDVWRILHPDSSLGPADHPSEQARRRPIPTAAFNLAENGATSDSVLNTWRWTKNQQNMLNKGQHIDVAPDAVDPRGKRLDYIFASTGLGPDDPPTAPGWVVKSASVALNDRHPTLNCSLSDHFAVRATLVLYTPRSKSPVPSRPLTLSPALQHGAYLANSSPAPSIRGDSIDNDLSSRPPSSHDPDVQLRTAAAAAATSFPHGDALPLSVYDDVLSMIHSYTTREVGQRYWRGVRFFVALAVWLACLIAVWFSPANFVAFILMLISSLGLTAGVIEGLLSLLFFSWEIRGLKEFEWEVRNAKAVAAGDLIASTDTDPGGKPAWALNSL